MAHTNATANYELSQFLGTDKPAWLVDYNGDMLKIDNALKDNADAQSASAEAIQELQDAIGAEGLTGRITHIENDIGDIKTEIGSVTLPTTAQSLTGAIAELKGVNDDQNTAIGRNADTIAQVGGAVEGVSQLAYTIANVYDSSATYAVGAYAIYQNTLYKCTTAITVGETFDPTKWTSVKVMSEVGQGGGTPTAADIDYNNTISGLSANKVQAAIDELASDIGASGAFGTTVSINSYNTFANAYVAPSDGYLQSFSTDASIIKVYGSNATADTDQAITVKCNNSVTAHMFIKKGMKMFVYTAGSSADHIFVPLS